MAGKTVKIEGSIKNPIKKLPANIKKNKKSDKKKK